MATGVSQTKSLPAIVGRWTKRLIIAVVLIATVGGVGMFAAQRWSETSAATPAAIETTENRQPVRVITARPGEIQAWVFAEGTARSSRREYLTFELSGRVTFVKPKRAGERVKKGEELARLDKRKYIADVDSALASMKEAKARVAASKTEITKAKSDYDHARKQFQRMESAWRKGATTESQVDEARSTMNKAKSAMDAARSQSQSVIASIAVSEAQLQRAKAILDEAHIVSPIDGIVAYLNVEQGHYFTQNFVKTSSESEALQTVPIVVIDPSEFEITVNVPAYEAGRIQIGQDVTLLPGGSSQSAIASASQLESTGDSVGSAWKAEGRVYSVNPAVNPGGRSIQVKIRTTDGASHLRDGMFVSCWIATEKKTDAVVVPFDAVLFEENRPYVFVIDEPTKTVVRRDIVLGIQGLRSREIVAGVDAGDRLVTEGRYRLVNGAPVTVIDDVNKAGGVE